MTKTQKDWQPGRMGKRRAWVLLSVQILIFLHILWWVFFGRTMAPLEPSETMAFAKEGVVNPGAILFALAILATLVFGRFFCGWGCHLLALQDGYRWILKRLHIPVRPFRPRLLRLVPIAAFVYMFLWPFLFRMQNGIPHPGVTEVELTTTAFWETFPGFWEGLLTLFLAGLYVVQVMGPKAFCTFACPYGAALSVADAFAPGSIRVTDACRQCGKCTAICSSSVRVHEEVRDFGMVISTDCMKTMDCIDACPNDALKFSFGTPASFKKRRAKGKESRVGVPSWPEEFLLLLFFAFGFFATEGLYGRVSFLLALSLGMVTSIFALQLKRAFTSANYRPGPKPWRLQKKWQRHGILKVLMVFSFLLLMTHSAWVQVHAKQRDAAFQQTLGYRNAWLQGQAALPAPSFVHQASKDALAATENTERFGLFYDPRDSFVHAWDRLFQGDVDGFEQGMLEVLELRPGFGEVLFQLGRHQSLMGRSEDAVESWRKVSPKDPRYFDVRRDMMLDLDALGRSGEADAIHAELLQRGYPEDALAVRILPDENGHSR